MRRYRIQSPVRVFHNYTAFRQETVTSFTFLLIRNADDLAVTARGIQLGIVSKNDESVALEAIDKQALAQGVVLPRPEDLYWNALMKEADRQ